MTADAPGNQVQLGGKTELAAAILDDLTGPDHLIELLFEQRTHALPFET